MVTNIQETPGTDRVTIRYLVRCIVEQSAAISAEQIAHKVSLNVEAIREELKYWVDKGLVEVLRPVTVSHPESRPESAADGRSEFYRWIRPTDTDYVWQAGLMRHNPLPRLSTYRPTIF